jgi:hypothetical protein
LRQLDIYKNEVVSHKEYERRKLELKEDHLKKELGQTIRENERMMDRQSELAFAYEEVTEDLKLTKLENDRLRERISIYDRQ